MPSTDTPQETLEKSRARAAAVLRGYMDALPADYTEGTDEDKRSAAGDLIGDLLAFAAGLDTQRRPYESDDPLTTIGGLAANGAYDAARQIIAVRDGHPDAEPTQDDTYVVAGCFDYAMGQHAHAA